MKLKFSRVLKYISIAGFIALPVISLSLLSTKTNASDARLPITITFEDGEYDVFTNKILSDVPLNASNCLVIPGPTLSDVISSFDKVDQENIVDCETFINKENGYSYSFTGWKVVGTDENIPMQTVFQPGDVIDDLFVEEYIGDSGVITLQALWGKCYFIENPYENMAYKANSSDYYSLDEINSSSPTGASDSNDGKTVNTPFASMDYLHKQLRINNAGHHFDAYDTVIMLTGNVDYYFNDKNIKNNDGNQDTGIYGYSIEDYATEVKNVNQIKFTSATYKSYQKNKGDVFDYNYKPKGYYNSIYCNLRFDNINYKIIGKNIFGTQSRGTEFQFFKADTHKGTSYFETTARFNKNVSSANSAIATFRSSTADYLAINGNIFTSIETTYSSNSLSGVEKRWYFGRNARVSNYITGGTTCAYGSVASFVTHDIIMTITGGTYNSIAGASNGMYSLSVGNRKIRVLGDGSKNIEYNPSINYIYGGGRQSRLFGNIQIDVKNTTINNNIYGGGDNFTATTYGNIDINIENSLVKGDVFGGGKNGNVVKTPEKCEKYSYNSNTTLTTYTMINTSTLVGDINKNCKANAVGVGGDVKVNIKSSNINGDVYGSGMGSTAVIEEKSVVKSFTNDWYQGNVYPEGWDLPINSYPIYDNQTGYVTVYAFKSLSWSTASKQTITFYHGTVKAYLSAATVENVDIVIDSSTIGKPNSSKGNIYGGGAIAQVLNNTNIQIINNSIVYGNVFGGGDGVTMPNKVKVFENLTTSNYTPPKYTITSFQNNGDPSNVSTSNESPIYYSYADTRNKVKYTEFSWSNDITLLDKGGIDLDNKIIYSPNFNGFGIVKGNCNVVIDSSTINGNVFGGGNNGVTYGNVTTKINNSTVNGDIFGGANQADVEGNVSLKIEGGNYNNIFGGNNLEGNIKDGKIEIEILNSTITDSIYGGGNQAKYQGNVNLTVLNTTSSSTFGGGKNAGVISTNVTINSSNITNLYGGGDAGVTEGDVSLDVLDSEITSAFGGGKNASVNSTDVTINSSNITNLYGGGDAGVTEGDVSLVITNNSELGSVFGGGKQAEVSSTNVIIDSSIIKELYGGGDEGVTNGDVIIDVNTSIIDTVFGGANKANISGAVYLTISTSAINKEAFGGNNLNGEIEGNNITLTFNNVTFNDSAIAIYGGGNQAAYSNTVNMYINGGKYINIYGGGKDANVGNTNIAIENRATINFVYGGGYNGNVTNSSVININSATINGNVYGGGYAGTINSTIVNVDDSTDEGNIIIYGNIFGGGEGSTATVYKSTSVNIDLALEFEAEETLITDDELTSSGEIKTTINTLSPHSIILGNVYGGGDLGQVGKGTIVVSSNTATNINPGHTSVTINNGHIVGSVFGGGSGTPKNDGNYNLYMGTIFGSTITEIFGGYIEGNIYGGGTQARLYFDNSDNELLKHAAVVNIYNSSILNNNKKIAIGGSVFGGGDKGNGVTQNASIPTTIGDVEVNITGNPNGKSEIYFINGGVYGDGNLCLVFGHRTINITNFNTGINPSLKTFYSLQRADEVILSNTKLVLLGAVDLVEEGDNSKYSINRVKNISMRNGSTIKLDSIVKYLGQIESDVMKETTFIDNGNNGKNNYVQDGGSADNITTLTDEEIYLYQEGLLEGINNKKNSICVANGLYLEIITEKNEYGNVFGLFTLQLLRPIPGEGGGFVYAKINGTTGDFICETVRNASEELNFIPVENPKESMLSSYYVFKDGEYVKSDSPFDSTTQYYYKNYMHVISNVVDYVAGKYTRYCWYISGSTIRYNVNINGYIGGTQTEYEENITIPEHDLQLMYTLRSLKVNDVLKNALSKYTLITSKDVHHQEISLEILIGDTSVGFLSYDYINDKWFILSNGNNFYGYGANTAPTDADVLENSLFTSSVDLSNNTISFVLHKSLEVDAEITNMQVILDLEIWKSDCSIYNFGTNNLVSTINFSIVRLVPVQTSYYSPYKYYSGVQSSSAIQITNNSAFTVQYQTRYIPNAFPYDEANNINMYWRITSQSYKYYMDSLGNYLTFDGNGNLINNSSIVLEFDGNNKNSNHEINTIYKDALNNYYYYTYDSLGAMVRYNFALINETSPSNFIPKGCKITMIDSTSESKQYYYYVCKTDMEYINLTDFILMGSKSSISSNSELPMFMKLYKDKGSSRISENLLFIFDLSDTNISSDGYSGHIILQHLYGGNVNTATDIMDFVQINTDVNGNNTYIRSYPLVTNYSISTVEDGIEKFDVEVLDKCYEKDSITLSMNIEESIDWINTNISGSTYIVKISLKDISSLPLGVYAIYDGNYYYPGHDNEYILIPLNGQGNNQIQIVNMLTNLSETVTNKEVVFNISLYVEEGIYFNDYTNSLTTRLLSSESIDIHPNPTYALNATLNKNVFESNENFTLNVNTKVLNEDNSVYEKAELSYLLYIKDEQGNYRQIEINDLFTSKITLINGNNTFTIKNQARKATYRLIVKYGDKTQYINFIIK